MLPLAIGMPVALTHHVDRSPDKLLLKGTIGRVHSWVWPENDRKAYRMPSCVYVKFPGATWQLDGVDEPGVYPVRSQMEDWFLDNRRKPAPVLKIKRRQIPLTPAFAITAHSSQGKTLPAVLLDLNVDKRVDVTFGAVAASRVRNRHDCLILRPFPLWLFTRGVSDGPGLLLQTLRGERIDWAAIREGQMPHTTCSQCKQVRTMDSFDHEQWDKVRANLPGMCLRCKHGEIGSRKRKLDSGTMKYVCGTCNIRKIEDAFPRAQLKEEDAKKCLSCCRAIKNLCCGQCGHTKPATSFHPSMATFAEDGTACKNCQKEAAQQANNKFRKDWFTCRSCREIFPNGAGPGKSRLQHCLNCGSRGTRQKDMHTCRQKGCKRTWHEKQGPGKERKRFCPDCRRK